MIGPISSSEAAYITAGCLAGTRNDGRGLEDYRSISIESNVFPQANGSSRVRLLDKVDILCSVKAEIGAPSPLSPSEGRLEVQVELSPLSFPSHEERERGAWGREVAQRLSSSLLSSHCLDLPALCLVPSKWCWGVCADIVVLRAEGDPTDLSLLSLHVALLSSLLPQTKLRKSPRGLFEDFDLSPDPRDLSPLPLRGPPPVMVTLHQIGGAREGRRGVLLVDAGQAEQACAEAALSLSFTRSPSKGVVCSEVALLRGVGAGAGGGGGGGGGGLSAASLSPALAQAQRAALSLLEQLERYTAIERAREEEERRVSPDFSPRRLGLLS